MPERPLLKLGAPDNAPVPPGPRNISKIKGPSRAQQGARLAPRFERLANAVGNGEAILQLQADAASLAPERAIVFEIAGSVLDFYKEAASIGLEYLADDEIEIDGDATFSIEKKPEQSFDGRLYMAMPDLRALEELLRLWKIFIAHGKMKNGFGMWTNLFKLLKDIRPWGPQDRVLPETLSYWKAQLAESPNEPVRFEIELWFREKEKIRNDKSASVVAQVKALGGSIVDRATIPQIRYDALLVELPAQFVAELADHPDVALARLDEIMFIRPQSLLQSLDAEQSDDGIAAEPDPEQVMPEPIAALLDGLPVQNHNRLRGRLIVDDPDGFEPTYTVSRRSHGTAMASLIIHGDLNANEAALHRPIYVRPVLQPTAGGHECSPDGRLVVDLIYQAVRRLKQGNADEAAVAPSVVLINLSLGDRSRPFSGPMSPWARLLDYLAYQHQVLFLVSAGNVVSTVALPDFATWAAFESSAPELRERALLAAVHSDKAIRTLLSPAESLNSITVGAAHNDSLVVRQQNHNAIDPFTGSEVPNLSSALGLGHRRVVKPDILMNGGKELVQMRSTNPHLHVAPVGAAQRAFGLLVAAPDTTGGNLGKTSFTFGTSGATALATRTAHQILDALVHDETGPLHDAPQRFHALLAKALLVHGASWRSTSDLLESVFGPADPQKHIERKDNVTRHLGYGPVDVPRTLECARNRATLIGYGELAAGAAVLYRVPLPKTLNGAVDFRSVTFTVAWFSPVNPRHQGYRAAAFDITPGGDPKYSLALERAASQPSFPATKRGSVLHERRESDRAAPYVDGGDLLFRISCRATAGAMPDSIPYAVVVSIEVGAQSEIDVYEEVRSEIAARVQI